MRDLNDPILRDDHRITFTLHDLSDSSQSFLNKVDPSLYHFLPFFDHLLLYLQIDSL